MMDLYYFCVLLYIVMKYYIASWRLLLLRQPLCIYSIYAASMAAATAAAASLLHMVLGEHFEA